MSVIKIREAVINDLPYIVKLMADDAVVGQRESYTTPLSQCYIDAFNNICNDKNSILLVSCDDEKVIGSLQVTFTQYLSCKGSMRATIENVYVSESYRNLGVGTQLMKYAVNLAKDKNCSIVQLTSNKTRKDAHRFYERLGFHATHEGMKLSLE